MLPREKTLWQCIHSSWRHYGSFRSFEKPFQPEVDVQREGDLRSHLHGVQAGERPGRGEFDGRCWRGGCREAAAVQIGAGVLDGEAPGHSEAGAAEHQQQREEAPAQKTQHCEAARGDQRETQKPVLYTEVL